MNKKNKIIASVTGVLAIGASGIIPAVLLLNKKTKDKDNENVGGNNTSIKKGERPSTKINKVTNVTNSQKEINDFIKNPTKPKLKLNNLNNITTYDLKFDDFINFSIGNLKIKVVKIVTDLNANTNALVTLSVSSKIPNTITKTVIVSYHGFKSINLTAKELLIKKLNYAIKKSNCGFSIDELNLSEKYTDKESLRLFLKLKNIDNGKIDKIVSSSDIPSSLFNDKAIMAKIGKTNDFISYISKFDSVITKKISKLYFSKDFNLINSFDYKTLVNSARIKVSRKLKRDLIKKILKDKSINKNVYVKWPEVKNKNDLNEANFIKALNEQYLDIQNEGDLTKILEALNYKTNILSNNSILMKRINDKINSYIGTKTGTDGKIQIDGINFKYDFDKNFLIKELREFLKTFYVRDKSNFDKNSYTEESKINDLIKNIALSKDIIGELKKHLNLISDLKNVISISNKFSSFVYANLFFDRWFNFNLKSKNGNYEKFSKLLITEPEKLLKDIYSKEYLMKISGIKDNASFKALDEKVKKHIFLNAFYLTQLHLVDISPSEAMGTKNVQNLLIEKTANEFNVDKQNSKKFIFTESFESVLGNNNILKSFLENVVSGSEGWDIKSYITKNFDGSMIAELSDKQKNIMKKESYISFGNYDSAFIDNTIFLLKKNKSLTFKQMGKFLLELYNYKQIGNKLKAFQGNEYYKLDSWFKSMKIKIKAGDEPSRVVFWYKNSQYMDSQYKRYFKEDEINEMINWLKINGWVPKMKITSNTIFKPTLKNEFYIKLDKWFKERFKGTIVDGLYDKGFKWKSKDDDSLEEYRKKVHYSIIDENGKEKIVDGYKEKPYSHIWTRLGTKQFGSFWGMTLFGALSVRDGSLAIINMPLDTAIIDYTQYNKKDIEYAMKQRFNHFSSIQARIPWFNFVTSFDWYVNGQTPVVIAGDNPFKNEINRVRGAIENKFIDSKNDMAVWDPWNNNPEKWEDKFGSDAQYLLLSLGLHSNGYLGAAANWSGNFMYYTNKEFDMLHFEHEYGHSIEMKSWAYGIDEKTGKKISVRDTTSHERRTMTLQGWGYFDTNYSYNFSHDEVMDLLYNGQITYRYDVNGNPISLGMPFSGWTTSNPITSQKDLTRIIKNSMQYNRNVDSMILDALRKHPNLWDKYFLSQIWNINNSNYKAGSGVSKSGTATDYNFIATPDGIMENINIKYKSNPTLDNFISLLLQNNIVISFAGKANTHKDIKTSKEYTFLRMYGSINFNMHEMPFKGSNPTDKKWGDANFLYGAEGMQAVYDALSSFGAKKSQTLDEWLFIPITNKGKGANLDWFIKNINKIFGGNYYAFRQSIHQDQITDLELYNLYKKSIKNGEKIIYLQDIIWNKIIDPAHKTYKEFLYDKFKLTYKFSDKNKNISSMLEDILKSNFVIYDELSKIKRLLTIVAYQNSDLKNDDDAYKVDSEVENIFDIKHMEEKRWNDMTDRLFFKAPLFEKKKEVKTNIVIGWVETALKVLEDRGLINLDGIIHMKKSIVWDMAKNNTLNVNQLLEDGNTIRKLFKAIFTNRDGSEDRETEFMILSKIKNELSTGYNKNGKDNRRVLDELIIYLTLKHYNLYNSWSDLSKLVDNQSYVKKEFTVAAWNINNKKAFGKLEKYLIDNKVQLVAENETPAISAINKAWDSIIKSIKTNHLNDWLSKEERDKDINNLYDSKNILENIIVSKFRMANSKGDVSSLLYYGDDINVPTISKEFSNEISKLLKNQKDNKILDNNIRNIIDNSLIKTDCERFLKNSNSKPLTEEEIIAVLILGMQGANEKVIDFVQSLHLTNLKKINRDWVNNYGTKQILYLIIANWSKSKIEKYRTIDLLKLWNNWQILKGDKVIKLTATKYGGDPGGLISKEMKGKTGNILANYKEWLKTNH